MPDTLITVGPGIVVPAKLPNAKLPKPPLNTLIDAGQKSLLDILGEVQKFMLPVEAAAAATIAAPVIPFIAGAGVAIKGVELFKEHVQEPFLGSQLEKVSPTIQQTYKNLRANNVPVLDAHKQAYEEWQSPKYVKGLLEFGIDPTWLIGGFGKAASTGVIAEKAVPYTQRVFQDVIRRVGLDPFADLVVKIKPGTAAIEAEASFQTRFTEALTSARAAHAKLPTQEATRVDQEALQSLHNITAGQRDFTARLEEKTALARGFNASSTIGASELPTSVTTLPPAVIHDMSRLLELQHKYGEIPTVVDTEAMKTVASLYDLKQVLLKDLGLPGEYPSRRAKQVIEALSELSVDDTKLTRLILSAENKVGLEEAYNHALLLRSGDAILDEAARRMGSKANKLVQQTLGKVIMNSAINMGEKGLQALSTVSAITESAKPYTAKIGLYVAEKAKTLGMMDNLPEPITDAARQFMAVLKSSGGDLAVDAEQLPIYKLYAVLQSPSDFAWGSALIKRRFLEELSSIMTDQTRILQKAGVPVETLDQTYLPFLFKNIKTDPQLDMVKSDYLKFIEIMRSKAPFQKERADWSFMEAINGGMRLRPEITSLSDVIQIRTAAGARALGKFEAWKIIAEEPKKIQDAVLKVLYEPSVISEKLPAVTASIYVTKTLKLGLDLSAYLVQGIQATAFMVEHPLKVIEEFSTGSLNMLSPAHYRQWITLNADRMAAASRDGVMLGLAILDTPEIRGGLRGFIEPFERVSNIPYSRIINPLKVTSYELGKEFLGNHSLFSKVFFGGKGLEEWQAGRESAEAVNKAFGGLNRIKNGETLTRLDALSIFEMVPGFTKATLGLIASSAEPTPQGALARKYLIGTITNVGAIATAMQYATTGTFPNLTDPTRGDWFMFRVKVGDRYTTWSPLARFRGPAKALMSPPQSVLKFLRAKTSLPLGELWTQIDQRTYTGDPIQTETGIRGLGQNIYGMIGRLAGPLAASQVVKTIRSDDISPAAAVIGVFNVLGSSVFIEPVVQNDIMNEMAKQAKLLGAPASLVDNARAAGLSAASVRGSDGNDYFTDAQRSKLFQNTADALGTDIANVRAQGRNLALTPKEQAVKRKSDMQNISFGSDELRTIRLNAEKAIYEDYIHQKIDRVGVRVALQTLGHIISQKRSGMAILYKDTLDYIEAHPAEHQNRLQLLYDDIAANLFGADVTDDLGNIDYSIYEKALVEMQKKYTVKTVADFFDQWRSTDKPPVVQEYYNEIPGNVKMRDYWKIPENVLSKSDAEAYRAYHRLGVPEMKLEFRRRFWDTTHHDYTATVERVVDRENLRIRFNDHEVSRLLVKWYGRVPVRAEEVTK